MLNFRVDDLDALLTDLAAKGVWIDPKRQDEENGRFAWIKDGPMRIAASEEDVPRMIDRVHDRIAHCWHLMDTQIAPGRYILGDELSVLDLYVTVISRFGPWRSRFYDSAPKMAAIVRRVDTDSRLQEFWAKRFPFYEDWEARNPTF